jgi:predicted ATP-grasp superfamily ATP-dependent carboligase
MIPGDPPGAVVVGGDYQGLGIVRSLGRHGIPVCVVDDEYSISRFSRFATCFASAADLRDEERAVQSILEIGTRLNLRGWVLYPTRDENVAAFARHRARLGAFFRVSTPEWETTKWLWDKRNTYRLAGDLGIPAPDTWYPETIGDLDKIHAEPPFAVKPAVKEHFFYATKAKAWRANNRDELRELFLRARQLAGAGGVMIQDLIPGDGCRQFAYCAFFKDGEAIGKMVVRRTRQHPAEFGRASTFVETVDLPIVEELSERFLRAVGYYGLVEVEFKLDPRDGKYKLLDVNGRTWGYHSLGYASGVDFPYLLFADMMGGAPSSPKGRIGTKWVRLATDLPTGVLEILKGRSAFSAYVRSLIACDTEAVFSLNDPKPGIAELALLPYLFIKRGF